MPIERMLDRIETPPLGASETERANRLYWKLVWIIEPALYGHMAQLHEPIEEKAKRLAMETLARGKAKAIIGEMRAEGFLSATFTPSVDAPF